jgi:hypothetical protein
VSTDADFRRAHFHDLLKDYFDVFERYLKDAGIEMTFEEFEGEVLDRRDILLSVSTTVMPTGDPSTTIFSNKLDSLHREINDLYF